MPRLAEQRYSQLVIDPPWPKKKGGLRKARPFQTRELDYSVMSVEDIFNLLDQSIFTLAAETHNVFLWTVDQFLVESERLMELRGYKRHARLIWNKENGVAPAFTIRYLHEYCIWFYKPNLLPVSKDQRGKLTTILQEKSREHSRKPEAIYNFVNTLYPASSRIDVFSREKREGWDQFGNETNKF